MIGTSRDSYEIDFDNVPPVDRVNLKNTDIRSADTGIIDQNVDR
jgi:hypothetical protein